MDNKWETEERKQKGQAGCDNVYGGVSVCHCIHYFSAALCSPRIIVFLNPFPSHPYPLKINVYHSIDAWMNCTALAHEYHYE